MEPHVDLTGAELYRIEAEARRMRAEAFRHMFSAGAIPAFSPARHRPRRRAHRLHDLSARPSGARGNRVRGGHDMTAPDIPTVRLTPKAAAQAIRHGFPWVYANELVTDRRTRALAPGTLAVLEDAERRPMGLVGVNPPRRSSRGCSTDPGGGDRRGWFRRA
jgi:hypothetical protein